LPAEAAPSYVWVAELPDAGARIALSPEESHYLAHVCRARVGDPASGTDGRGGLATLRLTVVGGVVEARVESVERAAPTRTAWLLCGAPEGARSDWLVEKLAELGVAVLQPVDCRRGVWKAGRDRQERWRRLAVAALRQSRRRFLLEVREPLALTAALAAVDPGARRWIADPIGPRASCIQPPEHGASVGLVGPAAGLDQDERDEVVSLGHEPMSLGDGRLRVETAGLAWAAWWSAGAGGKSPKGPELR